MGKMKDNIFISYSRSDSDFVIKLEEDLDKAGIFIWLDQKKITGGKLWDRAIEEALGKAGILIVVVSENSALSENVANEVQFARDEGKIIIPILIEQTNVPLTWRRYQRINFIENYEAGLNSLVQTLKLEMSLILNKETEKEGQPLKEETEIKLKADEDKRLEAETKGIEEEKVREEAVVKQKAEEVERLKKEAKANQKKEDEKRIREQAETTKNDKELVAHSEKNTQKPIHKKRSYKIPLIVAGVMAVLVIVMLIVNSLKNDNRQPAELQQATDIQNNNLNLQDTKIQDIDSQSSHEQPEPQKQATVEKDELLAESNEWNTAKFENTSASYQNYIDKYPNGKWTTDANREITNLDKLTSRTKEPQRETITIKDSEKSVNKAVENVIKAESVSYVEYLYSNSKGIFKQIALKKWEEKNPDGVFPFNETARDEWSIYLFDPNRNISIQIDLYKKQILLESELLYTISNYSNAPVK